MLHPHVPLRPLIAALAAASLPALAQTSPTQTIVITGNPLQREAGAQPATVLAGEGLLIRRSSTLGETLDGLPGVANTWFGPNAGRPVIRGLDGDRVRLLDNGGASVDASSLSFDHAVAIDPLVVERIEVLRGPAALLYGGNATGGVVNTLDNRIPTAALAGLSGRAELRLGGAASERSLGALVEGGGGGFAWHADAFRRSTDDLRVPRHVPVADGEALAPTTRVRNSAADSEGGAVGASWVGAAGYLGLSADQFRTDYGVTVEDEVTIRMKRDRLAAAGEWRGSGTWRALSFQASDTDYRHQEVEGSGEVGTTFDSRGRALRVQARHAPLGGVEGVVGLQFESLSFSALGEEAFVPGTRSRNLGLFVLESLQLGAVELTGGLRHEQVRVASDGDADGAEEPRFGPALERRFSPGSASLGAVWRVTPAWQLSAGLGRTERAPAYYELYANGLHLATGAFEQGDATLAEERSVHAELGLAWQQGRHKLSLQAFSTQFSNYIALDATGATVAVEDEETGGSVEVPVYAFRGVRARLSGLELEAGTGWAAAGWDWRLTGGLDLVRGHNRDTGEALARLAPLRLRAALEAAQGPWRAGLGLDHAARQDRVPATDTATDGHTRVDLWASWRQSWGAGTEALWFLRARNLGDTLAYSASTIGTLRGLVPLPGRSLSAGVQVAF
jgi:iron complex outermembrane receptor protein